MFIHGYHFVCQEGRHLELAARGLRALAAHLAAAAEGHLLGEIKVGERDPSKCCH